MRQLKLTIFALCVAVCFASCANPDKVHFQGIEGISLSGLSGMELTARIDNRSRHNIDVQRGRLILKDRGNEVAVIVLARNVVIPRRSDQSVMLPFNFVIANPVSLLSLPRKLKRGGDDITVSGDLTAKGGLLKKTYIIDETPLPKFLDKMGISGNDVTKYMNL